MAKRWVVECVWGGYRAEQSRPCHRRVYAGRPKLRAALEAITAVAFTDGTDMSVRVRDCLPRERVAEIRGYDDLLNKLIYTCGATGYVRLDDYYVDDCQQCKPANQGLTREQWREHRAANPSHRAFARLAPLSAQFEEVPHAEKG